MRTARRARRGRRRARIFWLQATSRWPRATSSWFAADRRKAATWGGRNREGGRSRASCRASRTRRSAATMSARSIFPFRIRLPTDPYTENAHRPSRDRGVRRIAGGGLVLSVDAADAPCPSTSCRWNPRCGPTNAPRAISRRRRGGLAHRPPRLRQVDFRKSAGAAAIQQWRLADPALEANNRRAGPRQQRSRLLRRREPEIAASPKSRRISATATWPHRRCSPAPADAPRAVIAQHRVPRYYVATPRNWRGSAPRGHYKKAAPQCSPRSPDRQRLRAARGRRASTSMRTGRRGGRDRTNTEDTGVLFDEVVDSPAANI